MKLLLASLALTHALVPPSALVSRRVVPLRSVDFDAFEVGSQTQALATRDNAVGDGDAAEVGDVITVKYAGRLLLSGKQFDAGTISFKLGAGRVIPGWDQGIVAMRVGGKRTLRIPSSLGYGAQGAGTDIPPNADLEFDCELLGTASGPIAELQANLGLGLNVKTLLIVLFALTLVPGVFPS